MKYTTHEFKGHDILQIWKDDAVPGAEKQFPVVAFGVPKAKAILASVEAIKTFVEKFDKPEE